MPVSRASISLPEGFEFNEVKPNLTGPAPATANPPLGAIAPFAGVTFRGSGFNNIFRPQNMASPTPLPIPPPPPLSGEILELNLTQDTIAFSAALGNVPNRGFVQPDIFLNGVPYVQTVNDVTFPNQSPTIHFEPGIWLAVPATTSPAINQVTYVRMASIPHGVTIQAQGTATGPTAGAPTIPAVSMAPFFADGSGPVVPPFPSLTAGNNVTPRIPQDLTSYIAAGTITQAILDDPNTVLRNALTGLTVLSLTTINISTQPAAPLFGGGTDNIAFLLGTNQAPPNNVPNADAIQMSATFWIETIQEEIIVPVFRPGQPALSIRGAARPGAPTPLFLVAPPHEILAPVAIRVPFTQIQYSQMVLLNFNGISWPHITVSTLVPDGAIPVPSTVWGTAPAPPTGLSASATTT